MGERGGGTVVAMTHSSTACSSTNLRIALLCAWPAATGAGGAVFGGDVDFSLVSLNLIGIILFTIVFEHLTEHLEESVEESPVYLDVVHKVYKELMILGVLSFVLAVSVEFGIHIPLLWLRSFEWAHMIIFAVAGLYLSNTILAIVGMEATFSEWVRAQNRSVQGAVLDLTAARAAGDANWRLDADFKIVRLIFLSEYSLPKVFDYMSYVKRKLHANVRHTIHIHVSTWLAVGMVVGIVVSGVLGFRATVDDRDESLTVANDTDGSRRRQLGGGDGSEDATCGTMFECESKLTARFAIGATIAVAWTVMLLQLGCVRLLSHKWATVFEKKAVPIAGSKGGDADAVAASLKEWQKTVDRRKIDTRADYDSSRRAAALEGRPEVTLMADLQEIYSESTEHHLQVVGQALQLLNCFCMAVYAVHVRVLIHSAVAEMPIPFFWDLIGATQLRIGRLLQIATLRFSAVSCSCSLCCPLAVVCVMFGVAVVLPALIIAVKLNPLSAKKAALLGGLVRLDVEMVADVFSFTDEVRDLRNRIQKVLLSEANAGQKNSEDGENEQVLPADELAALAAKKLFDAYDLPYDSNTA